MDGIPGLDFGRHPEGHLDPSCLERFRQGLASPQEAHSVVRHLLTGCASCSRGLAQLMAPAPQEPSGPMAGLASRRVHELIRKPAPLRAFFLCSEPALQTREMLEALLDRRSSAVEEPGLPLAVAELAVLLAALLIARYDPAAEGHTVRAWVLLAEARVRAGDAPGARSAANAARDRLARRTAGALVEAELLALEAEILVAEGQASVAEATRERAAALGRLAVVEIAALGPKLDAAARTVLAARLSRIAAGRPAPQPHGGESAPPLPPPTALPEKPLLSPRAPELPPR